MSKDKRNFFCMCVCVGVSLGLLVSSHLLKDYVKTAGSETNVRDADTEKHIKRDSESDKWDYFPNLPSGQKPKFGIVMGGTRNMFTESPGSELKLWMVSTCINRLYAIKHQYAFKVVTNMEDASNRSYGSCPSATMSPWNKILLMKKHLNDVEHLLWMDMDAVVVRSHVPIDDILNVSNKVETDLGQWMGTSKYSKSIHRHRTALTGSLEPFFWASQDINPNYWINLNSAVFVLKNIPLAFEFLDDVWAVGDDSDCFKRHDSGWQKKAPCRGG